MTRITLLLIVSVLFNGSPLFAESFNEMPITSGVVVWTEPAFPTKFDDVTVYFDATQGNGDLEGFQDDVYAHAGVITSESVNGNDWKHVIGNWGTADARVLMTRVEDDIYTLSYNITDFYGIPAWEEVLKLAFVFRNVNGAIVGRDVDGSDIFTDVYPSDEGLFLTLRSPSESDVVFYDDDSLFIDVIISDTAALVIYDNGLLIFSDTVDQLNFFHHPETLGTHLLRFEATKDTTVNLEKEYFIITRDQDKVNPPDGVVNGLNYFTDSTYLFQLYAPFKDYVFLLCPENQYKANADYQLRVAEDESTYWIELPRTLFMGGKSTYQYLLNGGIKIADPHSEVVLDPWHDPWVDADIMSTLPEYPYGMANSIVTAFDEEYQPYDFEVENFEKPEKSKLVIYELLVRDYLADHSFVSLKDTLDYFEKLGVNAIELMPISEFEGNLSWGYNISFHMAVDKYYGTREQLKAFIDAAHERGIAVILDVVFNHTFGQGPLAQMYFDPINFRPAPESPYLNVIPRHPFNVGFDFNHESQATKQWVKRILSYWLEEFKFDGFRFDLSKGLTQFNSGDDIELMARYDASRIAILEDYADQIWSVDSSAYVILEHFAENSEEIVLSDYGMMIWGNINYEFNEAAMGYSSDLEGVDYTFRGWNKPHLVGYMESHDEERLMYKLNTYGDSEGDYNTRETTTALQRMEAASAIFYSVPGPKMLYEFGELGYDFPINYCVNGTINNYCRLDPKPIRWDYLDDYRREHLRQVTAALIHLKTNYPTFSTTDFVFSDGNYFLKTVHLNHPDMDAVTLANFRVINSDLNPKFQYPGVWYEYFTGDSIVVTNTQEKITFGPGEYRLYTSKRIVPPGGFISGVRDLPLVDLNIFPNLISEGATVFCNLPSNSIVKTVIVYDMAGRLSRSCYYEVEDGMIGMNIPESVAAGLYVIGIQTDREYLVGKVVKQ